MAPSYKLIACLIYSVMISDGNCFGGDVVLDSFNKASADEDMNSLT